MNLVMYERLWHAKKYRVSDPGTGHLIGYKFVYPRDDVVKIDFHLECVRTHMHLRFMSSVSTPPAWCRGYD